MATKRTVIDERTLQKIRAIEDIWEFADLISFKGGRKTFDQMHFEMAKFNCQPQLGNNNPDARRRINLVPRGHYKSTVNTVLYSLWRIYRNPVIRIGVGCNVKDLAQSFIREMKTYLEDEELDDVWNNRPHIPGRLIPHLTAESRRRAARADETEAVDRKIVWNSYAIQVVRPPGHILKEPTVAALAVGMRTTGHHFDLLILDDIVDYFNSDTPTKANKVSRWGGDLESVLERKNKWVEILPNYGEFLGDELIINGTRYFKHDFYSYYVGNDIHTQQDNLTDTGYSLFYRNIYKNSVNNKDGYTCPLLFDEQIEKRIRKQLRKASLFYSQYMNQVISDDSQVFKSECINWLHANAYNIKGKNLVEITLPNNSKKEVRLFCVVDPAASIADEACLSVILIGGYDDESNLHLVDGRAGRYLPKDLRNNIFELTYKWDLSGCWFESNAQQVAMIYAIREYMIEQRKKPREAQGNFKPIAIMPIAQRDKKETRIEYYLEPIINEQRLFAPTYLKRTIPLTEQLDYWTEKSVEVDVIDCLATLAEVAVRTIQKDARQERQQKKRFHRVNKLYGGVR